MFGLIGHLTNLEHAQGKAHELGYTEYGNQGLDFWCSAPPQIIDHVKITSLTGQVIEGKYIESCFLPEMLAQRRIKSAIRKVLNAMATAQKEGLNITALGGFSSVIFENYNLSQNKQVRNVELDFTRFTTGNTHTAYIICRQLEICGPQLGIDLAQATVAVCGATGDIGSAVCRWLDRKTNVQDLLLIARNRDRLNELQSELGRGKIMDLEEALPLADIVVWVASMPRGVDVSAIPLKKPCLLIDGGYPKNMDRMVDQEGVHFLKGGLVEHEIEMDFRFMSWADMSVAGKPLFACFAEAMLLEFEQWHTNFSWGRNHITLEKMEQIGAASIKHGFRPLLLS